MDVNFTGISNPQIYARYKGFLVRTPEPYANMVLQNLKLVCGINDIGKNKDYSYFRHLLSKNASLNKNELNNIREDEVIFLDFEKSNNLDIPEFNIKLNEQEIPKSDRAIFGVCTLACSITRQIMENIAENNQVRKYAKFINSIADKIAREALNLL